MDEFDYGSAPTSGSTASLRTMPSDLAAERSVLSAMLLSPEALENLLSMLKEEDFFLDANKIIYRAIRNLFDHGMPVDAITIADHLTSTGELERAGGLAAIARLGEDSFSIASWQHHAKIVHRDSTLRLIIGAAAKISNSAYDAPEDTKEVVDNAEKLLLDVTNREISDSYVTIEDAMATLYDNMAKMAEEGKKSIGVQTGYPTMDKMFLGLRPGQMVVVGARPGVGKSSFALNLAVQAAERGASVAYFTLEMETSEVAERLVSAYSGVALQDIRSANIKGDQWNAVLGATQALSQLDLTIDDTPGTTVTEVRAKARRMLHGKENGLVILDYLQLVSPPPGRRSDSRATEVSEMSRGIKILAKDLGIPVVALSQLSRKSEDRTGSHAKRPQLSDLRESGSIEQDADIVVLLDRSMTEDEAERDDRPDWGVTQFIVAKNRSGPLGIIDMVFHPDKTKFLELDYHADE